MRVVIIGTSGAGKSTFAAALAREMECPHVELDCLYWGPAWVPVPAESFEAGVRAATAGDRWVADGNCSAIRELLSSRATHNVCCSSPPAPAAAPVRAVLHPTTRPLPPRLLRRGAARRA